MADEGDEKQEDVKKAGGKKKLVILILGVILFLGAGVGGSLYFTGMLGGGGEHESEPEEENKEAETTPIYFAFPEAFTVNFETENGLRFLQVKLEIMSYDEQAIAAVQTHMPVIKNNIILLLSDQSFDGLVSMEGKTKLRELALKEIQNILKKYDTPAAIEEIYFTNFVMQ